MEESQCEASSRKRAERCAVSAAASHLVKHAVGERDGSNLLQRRADVDGREHVESGGRLEASDLDVTEAVLCERR